jgi:FkbM family methyltransferase
MTSLIQRSPFRQLAHAYGSLLSLAGSGQEISRSLARIAAALAEQAAATPAPAPAPAEKMDIDVHRRFGFDLMLDKSSLVDRTVIETGQWEPQQLHFLSQLAEHFRGQRNTVFLDIGSYWGLYSFMMLKTRIFDQILAFEADGHNFAQLQTNVFLNRAAREIKAANLAVTDRDHTLHVWDSLAHPDGNRGGVGIAEPGVHFPITAVQAVAIDSYLPLSGANLLIKIDVEGHEKEVIAGLARTVRDNKVIMQVEIYEPQMAVAIPLLEGLGLRRLQQIEHDFYYTNIAPSELGR